jgi:hypothetical protein
VLDERDHGGGVVEDGVIERPERLVAAGVAVLRVGRAGVGRFVLCPAEPDQGADDIAGAGGELRMLLTLDGTIGGFVNDRQVKDADDVTRRQRSSSVSTSAAEVGPVEADDEELDGSEAQ